MSNTFTHSKIELHVLGMAGVGFLVVHPASSSNSDGVAIPQPRVAGEARYPG